MGLKRHHHALLCDWLVSKVEVQGSQVEGSVSAADFILRSFGAASGLPCQLSVAIKVVVQVVDCSAVLLHPQVVQVWQEMLKHSRCITCSSVVMATMKEMLEHGRRITRVGMATMKEMLKRDRCHHLLKCGYGSN